MEVDFAHPVVGDDDCDDIDRVVVIVFVVVEEDAVKKMQCCVIFIVVEGIIVLSIIELPTRVRVKMMKMLPTLLLVLPVEK